MRNNELVQKINFNLSGINLNGILVAKEESDKAIKNLLELRSQVTEIIDLLESMKPIKPEEEKPFTDVIPIPSNDFSLAQKVEQYQKEKEEVSDNSTNEQAGIKRSRYFAEGSGKKQPHSKSCFYSLNGEYSAKLISVKNLLSFSERVSQDMLKVNHVLETKVFKEYNTEYILLSVFCNLMNTDYSTVSKYAEGDSDKFAIALFENETGRESARKLIELNYALGIIKQYGFKIKVKNVEFEGYLNLKYLLDLSTAISRRSLKDHYFEGKPLLAYIMNNSRYPWYYLNYNNTSIKESWSTYENYANTGDCNFDTKKRLFNDFLEVGFSSFENRFSRPVRQDVDFCRSAITVYDEATDNYYAVFGTRKEFAVMLIDHTDNRLDKIIEASYMLRDKIYTIDELAELCDRKQDWVVKAINHLGLDPEFINKDTARDVMQLSTKSIVTAAYNEEK
nr:MAG TPA: hypothetical protein [Caudoviricetes sp.]